MDNRDWEIYEAFKKFNFYILNHNQNQSINSVCSQYRVHYGKNEIWLLSDVIEPEKYIPQLQYILKEINTRGLPKSDVGYIVTIIVKHFFTNFDKQWNLFPCMSKFDPYISWFYDIDLEHDRILVCLPPDNITSGKAKISDITNICDGTTADSLIVVKTLLDSMLKNESPKSTFL